MDRVRYSCRLETGGVYSQFWCDDLENIQNIVNAVCSGAQVRNGIALTVTDTACHNGEARVWSPTVLGFRSVVESMLTGMQQMQTPPLHEGQGRDVVVEVKFAAHDATLTECRHWTERAIDEALNRDAGEEGGSKFSFNGRTVGDAWFE